LVAAGLQLALFDESATIAKQRFGRRGLRVCDRCRGDDEQQALSECHRGPRTWVAVEVLPWERGQWGDAGEAAVACERDAGAPAWARARRASLARRPVPRR